MGLEIFLYRKTYLSQEYVTLNEFSLWEQGMRKISLADTSKVERSHCSAVSGAFWTAMVKANYCKYVFLANLLLSLNQNIPHNCCGVYILVNEVLDDCVKI